MTFPWLEAPIPGVFRVGRPVFEDDRGSFVKVLGEGDWGRESPFTPVEVFWSRSGRGVFRGMHVQLPPFDGRKLVFVVNGAVRDFVVDLRVGSPTFREVLELVLDEGSPGVLVPEGCGHGFEALTDDVIVVYGQDTFHHPDSDGGVLYSSLGIELSAKEPVVSSRDLALPSIDAFASPFEYA